MYTPLSRSVSVPIEETVHVLVAVLCAAGLLAVVLWRSSSPRSTPGVYVFPRTSTNEINQNFMNIYKQYTKVMII
jgi:hypothetical protein